MSEIDPLEKSVRERAGDTCELCSSTADLISYQVEPVTEATADRSLLVCAKCLEQVRGAALDATHWFCLKDTIWSEVPAVQVLSWRLLGRLGSESWAVDLLDQAYLEPELDSWARADQAGASVAEGEESVPPTLDSNGTELLDGDSVSLVRNLDVKGANFTAKRGTIVKNIVLTDNPEHVEGRVNRTEIVLKTCFLKKV